MRKPVIMERRVLTEGVVVNPEVADMIADVYAQKVRGEVPQGFMKRRIRQELLRREDLHYPVSYEEAKMTAMQKGQELPPFVQTAMQQGQRIYRIPSTYELHPENHALQPPMEVFFQQMDHIVDWLNAMSNVAERRVNQNDQVAVEDRTLTLRAIDNLKNQTIPQALEASEKWYARMGSRAKGAKDDVVILKKWSDGFYAVQYRSDQAGLITMRNDGNDLQNCLRSGHYENALINGTAAIFAIRRPNDEAVVAISLDGNKGLREVKGKNNKPVVPQYVKYTVDLLNMLKVVVNGRESDLVGAEIEYQNGRFFSFEQEAVVILDQPNVTVRKSEDMLEIKAGASSGITLLYKFKIVGGQINAVTVMTSLRMTDQGRNQLIIGLNAAGIPPCHNLADELVYPADIYYGNDRYGTFEDVSEKIYDRNDVIARRTDAEIRLWSSNGQKVGLTLDENGHIDNMSAQPDYSTGKFSSELLVTALTDMKIVPTADGLIALRNHFDVDYAHGRYGTFQDIAKLIHDRDGLKTWVTDTRFMVTYRGVELRGVIHDKQTTSLKLNDQSISGNEFVAMLNTIKVKPNDASVTDRLFDVGVIWTGARYAMFADEARTLYEDDNWKLDHIEGTHGSFVLNKRRPVIRPSPMGGAPALLDTGPNYQRFGIYEDLIREVGRQAIINMANASGYEYTGAKTIPVNYGFVFRGGPGKYKTVEAGKPAIFENFYQISDTMWAIAHDASDVIYLTLKNGELKVVEKPHSIWDGSPIVAKAIQWIVNNNHVLKYDGPEGGGLLDLGTTVGTHPSVGGGLTADFNKFLDKLKTMDDAAYLPFFNGDTYSMVRSFFRGVGELTRKQQQMLYVALKPKAPFYKVELFKSYRVYGVEFDQERIILPAAEALIITGEHDGGNTAGFTDPEIIEKIENDMSKAVDKAIAYMLKNADKKTFLVGVGAFNHMISHKPHRKRIISAAQAIMKDMSARVDEAQEIDEDRIKHQKLTLKDFSEAEINDRYRSAVQIKLKALRNVTGH